MILNMNKTNFFSVDGCDGEEEFLASAEPIHQRALPLLSFPRVKTRMSLAKSRKSKLFDMDCLPQL